MKVMKLSHPTVAISLACLGLVACHFGGGGGGAAPSGQVVATYDGQEITLTQLHAELNGVNPPNPAARKAAEQSALKAILTREILAKAAHDQGIDKTPDFAIQKKRLEDTLLAESLQSKLAKAVPPPTREEADRFVTDHPDIFAARKIFTVDQIRMARPSDPKMIEALQPLKTLADIEAFLTREHVEHSRVSNNLDAVGADPRLIDAIVKLPAGEVFVIPGNGGLLVNQIRETKVVPFTGDAAVNYAMAVIGKQRTQEAVSRRFNSILSASAKTVRYNPAYQPPKAPAAAPAQAAKAATGGT